MAQPIKSAARAAESNRPRKKSEEKLETAGMMRWLLTYADMITLMLALFIILFAMSTISRVKVQAFAKSVSAGFNNVWTVNQPPNGGANGEQSFEASSSIPAIQKELEKYVKENHLEQQVQVHSEARGLVVTLLSDKSFYDSGSAEIRPATLKILDGIPRCSSATAMLLRSKAIPTTCRSRPTSIRRIGSSRLLARSASRGISTSTMELTRRS